MLVRMPGWGPRGAVTSWAVLVLIFCSAVRTCTSQDYNEPEAPPPPPKEVMQCNGIFASYTFEGREKEYPLIKNVTGQSWAFQSSITVLNTGVEELKSWQVLVQFQYNELIVSVDGGVVLDGDGSYPIKVSKNGTVFAGFPQTDLKTAIETAADFTKMQAQIKLKGTQFGGGDKVTPLPKTIKLLNPGFKCPAPVKRGGNMHVCCKKDPKFKEKNKNKVSAHRYGDLEFTFDVIKAYDSKYTAQVTIENNHPIGRLDQWNLTWEWMNNEFINSMRGAYTHKKDASECIYGPQGNYYRDFDFTNAMNCQKKPVISDLPPELENDDKIGKLPYCCKDGILLPKSMNETKSRAIFQMEVFKLPPDLNRTAITPPQNWKIVGRVNPTYKCGPPVRVEATEFPDPTGLDATVSALATWQISCNMTRPKPKEAKCCVSYSAYFAEAAIPCNTCACGCDDDARCDAKAAPMAIPPDSLLVPFVNRTAKAKALARMHNHKVPRKLPCPDNCGVSINWHIDSVYKSGYTARMTIFNWEKDAFSDWFSVIQLKKGYRGHVNMYSFNATKVPKMKNTLLMQGLPGLNYLVGETNGTHPGVDPLVPGKQQTVITFSNEDDDVIDVEHGEGFPARIFFNGGECALPKRFPSKNGAGRRYTVGFIPAVFLAVITFLIMSSY